MRVLASTADRVSAGGSVATAVMAVLAGVVAIWTLIELKRDSRERTRPIMLAQLRPRLLAHGVVELAIENVGHSVAKDVQVAFTPALPDLEQHKGGRAMVNFIQSRYARSIPTLAPGRELINVYGHFVGNGSRTLDEPGVPWDVTVAFTYKDTRGKSYEDRYELTVDTLLDETTSNPSNTDDKGMRRRWVSALEAIARGVGRH